MLFIMVLIEKRDTFSNVTSIGIDITSLYHLFVVFITCCSRVSSNCIIRLFNNINNMMATARKQCQLRSHNKTAIWQKIYNVLFITLLLFTTVGSPLLRIDLSWKTQAELVNGTEHWPLHSNFVTIIRPKSYHHNLAGLYAIYSSVLRNGCASIDHFNHKKQREFISPARKVHSVLLLLLLLSGDVQLNPGPVVTRSASQVSGAGRSSAATVTRAPEEVGFCGIPVPCIPITGVDASAVVFDKLASTTAVITGKCQPENSAPNDVGYINPAVKKHIAYQTFQTVNHAKVVWDPKRKPRGLLGAHLNIRSIISKTEQLTHLLANSNLDFLCISETWLQHSTPINVFTMNGFQCFRRDRTGGRGGGVLMYVKDSIKCERMFFKPAISLEYVALKVVLSQQMSFIIIGLYRPPTANDTFYTELANIIKECDHNKEIILMGDFNLNWEDKLKRRKLKAITDKFHLEQLIKGSTRITKRSSTQLDLFFSNKPERIIKSYNLITGLSDHNLTLVARKLTKNRFKNNISSCRNNALCIPKCKQDTFNTEIHNLDWGDVLSSENLEHSCQLFTSKINVVRDKFTVKIKRKNRNKVNLPWFSEYLWKLMKSRDAALKKSIKVYQD